MNNDCHAAPPYSWIFRFTKDTLILGLVIALLLCCSCGKKRPTAVFSSSAGHRQVFLELVETEQEKAQGLMFRNRLEDDHGMLFIYHKDVKPSFWMKNTFLSLDILFLAKDGTLVDIFEQVPPCPMKPCPTYTPSVLCRYVLEVKGGYAAQYHIRKGDRVELCNIENKAKKTVVYTAGEQKGRSF